MDNFLAYVPNTSCNILILKKLFATYLNFPVFLFAKPGKTISMPCAKAVASARKLLGLLTTWVVFYDHKFLGRKLRK